MRLWKVALLAFVAMCAEDLLATAMVIEEAHYNALAAGILDVLGWAAGLICSALAIESIITNGWRTRKSITIILAVSVANFLGTFGGVGIGHLLAR